ncbi:hypothetical protein Agabi119p4_7221 [Agaricus bisporus var. burnettii]|uniref:Uncharacterized protein n=1 Tax=Agaricus bisporus var. burnettii TaxID=192524 RepID=A0A8H7C7D1_AGABI|nr:hypothetical protein Agabi119p4_7221 [Agaricus bisporus var. burnettii]
MDSSNNVNKSVSTNKAPGYTKTVIGKDMSSKTASQPAKTSPKMSPEPSKKSSDPEKTSTAPANASSASPTSAQNQSGKDSQDPNPMSSTGFARKAKKDGLAFTSPVRPTF